MSTIETPDDTGKSETTTVKIDKQTRDRFRAFRDAVEDAEVKTYDDALWALLEIAADEGYWDGGGDGGETTLATAEEVAELREGQQQLFEAMKQNRQAIQALQSDE